MIRQPVIGLDGIWHQVKCLIILHSIAEWIIYIWIFNLRLSTDEGAQPEPPHYNTLPGMHPHQGSIHAPP